MKKMLLLVLILLVLSRMVIAQIFPADGSTLNYRIVGLSFPKAEKETKYKIEIAAGNYNNADSFKNHIISTLTVRDNKIITEVPFFGTAYTWRVATHGRDAGDPVLHHFSTLTIPGVDTSQARLRVVQHAKKYKDSYVFLDGNRALYDMDGMPVWYLPDIDGFNTDKSALRDLKLSPQGTITFLYEEHGAYEINFNGKILWKAPNDGTVSGDGAEHYHHEFTRMPNGHYMVLSLEYELWNRHLPSADSSYKIFPLSNAIVADSNRSKYEKNPFGTLIEYDEQGNVVWSWKSSDYFRNSDIYYHNGRGSQPEIAAHENSFYFDEATQTIYIGFRNISRIVKVKYPEGTVSGFYGETFKPGVPEAGNGLFCRQHSVRRSARGYLYLYDNNTCNPKDLPELLKLEEPSIPGGGLTKVWQYDCTTEGALEPRAHYQFTIGGNVTELPDGCLFANMSTNYSKVFILSPDKEILWSAIPEKWNTRFKKWEMFYQYRASLINRGDVEKLVWDAEFKK